MKKTLEKKDLIKTETQDLTIDQLERTEIEVKEFTRYKELFGWLLIPAMVIGLGTHAIDRTLFRKQL